MVNNELRNEPELNLTGAFTWKPSAEKDGHPTLLAGRCTHCNETFFPLLQVCPRCFDALETVPLSDTGILYSYSIVHIAPTGFSTPYAIGYVDLQEGVRVFAQLAVQDFAELHPGLKMTAIWGPIRVDEQGEPVYSYKFQPVIEQQEVAGL